MIIEDLEIIKIFDKITQENVTNYKIEKITHKYSNTKIPIYKLIVENKEISRNNNFCVEYKCPTCKLNNIITLNIFLRKLNKEKTELCKKCVNIDPLKTATQSETLHKTLERGFPLEKIQVKSLSLEEKIKMSQEEWEKEDPEFKETYLQKYLSLDEFNNIKTKILSINNGAIILNNDWEYIFNFRIYNQTKYNPMMVNLKDNIVLSINYIKFCCENCGETFVNRDLFIQKNRIKIFCKDCSFSNKIFKVKYLKVFDENVRYNSNYEKRFLIWCIENEILIKNGPIIEYIWNDKQHKYLVDFEVKNKNIIIELKDNHHWHKKNIKEGKFSAKNLYTEKWCETNKYKFYLTFPKNLNEIKDILLSL